MNGKDLLICLIALLLPLRATADGNDAGGGGLAVVCRSPSGQIQSAQLLDLFEAEVVSSIRLRSPSGDLGTQYIRYLEHRRQIESSIDDPFSPDERAVARQRLVALQKYFRFSQPKESIPRTSDAGVVPPMPLGCQLEQLAYFDDQKIMTVVNSEIWEALDTLNQMALYAHEYFYRRYRLVGERSSQTVRKVVGLAFAEKSLRRVQDGVPASALACMTHGPGETYFYIFDDPADPGGSILQFNQLMGRNALWPTRIKLDQRITEAMLETRGLDGVFLREPGKTLHSESAVKDGPLADYRVRVDASFSKPVTLTLLPASIENVMTRQSVTVYGCRSRSQFDFGNILAEYSYIDPFQEVPADLLKEALIYFRSHSRSIRNKSFLAIIDFSEHSSVKRLHLVNIANGTVESTYVAHGVESDTDNDGLAERFGGVPGSRMTSLGYFLAGELYTGREGWSLRIRGLNSQKDDVEKRALTLSGAEYVRDEPVLQGRSWGGFTVPINKSHRLTQVLKDGSLIYSGFSR